MTNGQLEHILTKTMSLHWKDWVARLHKALWMYRTTSKFTTRFTPFQLVYGKTAVMPIEFEHKTLWTTLELDITLLIEK